MVRVKIEPQRRTTISFRARVAADTRSLYTVTAQIKGSGVSPARPDSKDVAAGTVVKYDLWVAYRGRGTLRVDVGYDQLREPAATPFMGGADSAKVGRAEAKVG